MSIIGFPRIGKNRELKKALESFWAKKNFLAKGFLDYKIAPMSVQYCEMPESSLYRKSHQTLHSLTLGASVNIAW